MPLVVDEIGMTGEREALGRLLTTSGWRFAARMRQRTCG